MGTPSKNSATHDGDGHLLRGGVRLCPAGTEVEGAPTDQPPIGIEELSLVNRDLQRTPPKSRTAFKGDILVADDEPLVRKFIATVLMSEGYRVLQARNSLEALLCWREHRHFDLIVSDVNMPDMSGPDFVEAIWMQDYIPVLFMSGLPPDDTAWQHVLDGRAQFLPKPFVPLTLRRKVQAILKVRQPYRLLSHS